MGSAEEKQTQSYTKTMKKAAFITNCHQSLSHFNTGPSVLRVCVNLDELTVDVEQLCLHPPLFLSTCLFPDPLSVVNIENNTVQALVS